MEPLKNLENRKRETKSNQRFFFSYFEHFMHIHNIWLLLIDLFIFSSSSFTLFFHSFSFSLFNAKWFSFCASAPIEIVKCPFLEYMMVFHVLWSHIPNLVPMHFTSIKLFGKRYEVKKKSVLNVKVHWGGWCFDLVRKSSFAST